MVHKKRSSFEHIGTGLTAIKMALFWGFVPPGWYELRGSTSKCQECPPGSYCPGGRATLESVLYECPVGTTSPSGSASSDTCQCKRGRFWDLQVNACSLCPAGYFKNHTGFDLCTSCPQQATSNQGAIGLQECYCPAGKIDLDSSDNLNCTDMSTLQNAVSNSSFARTEALMHGFNGSILSFGGAFELEIAQLDLITYLGLSDRALLQLTDQLDYKVTTSEEEEAQMLHAKMDPSVFAAWAAASRTFRSARVTRGSVAVDTLRCPEGSGFVSATWVRSLVDCQCMQGMEPNALTGCSKCPRGKHKATVADAACSSCGGLTTLQEGAISNAACTCPAGYVNEVAGDPSNCQPCGKGFYCIGGKHKQACGQSLTTATETASDLVECICSSGFFRVESMCEPCPKGRFKADIGDGSCQPCPAGRWSNQSAAAQEDACNFCMEGSTTRESGAADLSVCVRPQPGQVVQCTSGAVCDVELTGFQLQDGHRLALTTSSCDSSKVAVSGVVAQGISNPATSKGIRYVWGQSASDFIPEGGLYNLCWCAGMRQLSCTSLKENFVLPAGQLKVAGPFANHSFDCVRGQDCSDLRTFGHLLSVWNQVAVRYACGGSEFLSVASANPNGTGSLATSNGNFSVSFGEILLNADEAYALCWCGVSCNSASDFAVQAGHLRVLGPFANQRADCFLGQPCRLQNLQGVGLMLGDQIMLRADCVAGPMLPGSPGSGIASRKEA